MLKCPILVFIQGRGGGGGGGGQGFPLALYYCIIGVLGTLTFGLYESQVQIIRVPCKGTTLHIDMEN